MKRLTALLLLSVSAWAADYKLWVPDDYKIKLGDDSDFNLAFDSTQTRLELNDPLGNTLLHVTDDGTTGTLSVSGKLSSPLLNLTPGSAPVSPQNGDGWTTSGGLYWRINGATQGPYLYSGGAGSFTTISASGQITSTVSTGTAPLVIASTTKVTNLNVDQLDGYDWANPTQIGDASHKADIYANAILGYNGLTLYDGILTVMKPGTQYIGGDSGSVGTSLYLNSPYVYKTEVMLRRASSPRWSIYNNNDSESGLNAGSTFKIDAYNDAGSYLDTPIAITRASGGDITLSRPLVSAGNVAANGGSFTTTSTTGTLFPQNATTVNIAAAATTLTIGNASGVNAVNGTVDFAGNTAFGNNAAVTASIPMRVKNTFTPTSGTLSCLWATANPGASATSSAYTYTTLSEVQPSTAQTITGHCIAVEGSAVIGISGSTAAMLKGVEGYIQNSNQGTATVAYGVVSNNLVSSTGTIPTWAGFYCYSNTNTTANAVGSTVKYGQYIGDISGGAANYAIYTNNGAVRFGDTLAVLGNTQLGDASTDRLGVNVAANTNNAVVVLGGGVWYKGTKQDYATNNTDLGVFNDTTGNRARLVAGQDTTNFVGLAWVYDATPANAYAALNVSANQELRLQNGTGGLNLCSGGGAVKAGTGAVVWSNADGTIKQSAIEANSATAGQLLAYNGSVWAPSQPINVDILNTITTSVGNVGTGEDDLMTYTVPAATCTQAGDSIYFEQTFATGNSANTKQIRVYFAGTKIYESSATDLDLYHVQIQGRIVRMTSTTARAFVWVTQYSNSGTMYTPSSLFNDTFAVTWANTNILKATGQGTSNDDIVQYYQQTALHRTN